MMDMSSRTREVPSVMAVTTSQSLVPLMYSSSFCELGRPLRGSSGSLLENERPSSPSVLSAMELLVSVNGGARYSTSGMRETGGKKKSV